MTTGASSAPRNGPPFPPRNRGGPLRFQNVIRLSSHTNKWPPADSPCDRHHHERRYASTSSSNGTPFNTPDDDPPHMTASARDRSQFRVPQRPLRPNDLSDRQIGNLTGHKKIATLKAIYVGHGELHPEGAAVMDTAWLDT